MSDIFDERRKGLEDEYFNRKNREALEKLREQRAQAGKGERSDAPRHCPLGHGALTEIAFDDVFIDRCPECQGVWLDAGELEHLTHREASGGGNWFFRLFGTSDEGEK
ncbi:MAG TPA: zf-TFIIB domain-containing protein [Pyrinomonadaceae bacterium]|jgi:hypothetical protein